MIRKIPKVKDWKLIKEGKQFVPVSLGTVRRLKDDCIFEGGVAYSYNGSKLVITEFNLDLIHVNVYVWDGVSDYYKTFEINRLIKSTNEIDGVYGIEIKQTVRRRRGAPKK